MNDVKLGNVLAGAEQRDAVHIAIAPVEATCRLNPGQRVEVIEGKAVPNDARGSTGIVDPFLRRAVEAGEKFWVCLYQGTVTGMQHHWSHPSFTGDCPVVVDANRMESEQWIRRYAATLGADYHELMEAASCNVDKPFEYFQLPYGVQEDTDDEFWVHFAALTGRKGEGNFFSCSC